MLKLHVAAMQQLKDAQEQQIAQVQAANIIHGINNGQGAQPDQSGKVFTPPPAANINQPSGIESAGGPNAGSAAGDRRFSNVPATGAE